MKWEYYLDVSYFDLWAVRPRRDNNFNSQKLFHVPSQEEAKELCCLLDDLQDCYDALDSLW